VNRALRQLRAERLLDLDGKAAHILDWDGLVARAEFDPVYLQFKAIDFHQAGTT
jgi:hypothetical protein